MAAIVANTGSNNWNTAGAWVGGIQPTAADDVTIPASAVVTIPTATIVLARSVTVAALGTLAFASTTAELDIGDGTAGSGNVAFSNAGTITLTGIGIILFKSTSTNVQTITSGGATLPNITINGVGSKYQLADAMTIGTTTILTLTTGQLDTNGKSCSWGSLISTNSNVRTLTLGASTITLTGLGTVWNIFATNLTLNANTSTLAAASSTCSFIFGTGTTYNNITLTNAGTATLNSVFTCANLTRTTTAVKTDSLQIGNNFTVTGTLTLNSNSVINRLRVNSSTPNSSVTITANALVCTNVIEFEDITGAGTATWTTAASGATYFGDIGGNSGITMTTSATQTATGTASFTWSTHGWTSRVPLPQDDVVVNNAFVAGRTITIDMPRIGKNVDFSGMTGTPAISYSAFTVCGNLTFTSAMTISGSGSTITLNGKGNYTFTTAGALNMGSACNVFVRGGAGLTYTQVGNLTIGGLISFDAGNYTVGANNITAGTWRTTIQTQARTIDYGSGTITLNGTGTVWNDNSSNVTRTVNTSTVVINDTSVTAKSLIGNNVITFYNLSITGSGTGAVQMNSSTIIANTLTIGAPKTFTLTAGTTTAFTALSATGSAGNLITINSTSAGTAGTFSCSAGVVSCNWLSLQDNAAIGGAPFYAGANSTNVSGNSGWVFTAPVTATGTGLLALGVG